MFAHVKQVKLEPRETFIIVFVQNPDEFLIMLLLCLFCNTKHEF